MGTQIKAGGVLVAKGDQLVQRGITSDFFQDFKCCRMHLARKISEFGVLLNDHLNGD